MWGGLSQRTLGPHNPSFNQESSDFIFYLRWKVLVKNEEEEEGKEKVREETKRNPEQQQMESQVYGFSQNRQT